MSSLCIKTVWCWKFYEFKDGPLINEITRENIVVIEGLNDVITQYFKGVAYTASPFIGLVRSDNFTTYAITDTAAKIVTGVPGGGDNQWRESIAYTEATRQALTLGTATGGSIGNAASLASFTMNASVTIRGGFLISNSTKGGITGKLFSAIDLLTPQPLVNGNVFTVLVNVTASN